MDDSHSEDRRTWKVRVEPLGVSLVVEDGETLMHAAERLGYRWPTACHGHAECTLCAVDVTDAPDAFAPPEPRELAGLRLFEGRTFYRGKVMRLACQAKPVADTQVTKRGVRRVT